MYVSQSAVRATSTKAKVPPLSAPTAGQNMDNFITKDVIVNIALYAVDNYSVVTVT